MNGLYLALDANDEPAVWADNPERPGYPFCVARKRDIDPLLWTVVTERIPTRDEPQDEPTDPGVRVRDRDGVEWVRLDGSWITHSSASYAWDELEQDHGPLEVIQPDAPSADERPFKVGDLVKVADDASWDNGEVTYITSKLRGRTCYVTRLANARGEFSVNLTKGIVGDGVIAARFLTHADAPC